MPIYEYLCDICRRRFSALVGVVAGATRVSCPRCGGTKLTKLVSRFASFRSEQDRDDFSDLEDLPDSPQAARRWARKMSREFGDEAGADFEDEIEAAAEEEDEGETAAQDDDF